MKNKKKDDTYRRVCLKQQHGCDKNIVLDVEVSIGTASITGMDASEYPTIPAIDVAGSTEPFALESIVLKQAIALTAFAAADDETRPVLAGTYLEPDFTTPEHMHIVTADAFRMAYLRVQSRDLVRWAISVLETNAPNLLIPTTTLEILAKMLPETRQSVFCYHQHQKSQALFLVPSTALSIRFTSRVIEGQFPNFRQIIPQQFQVKVELPVTAMLEAYQYHADLAKDSSNITRLIVAARTAPLNEGDEELPRAITVVSASDGRGERTSTIGYSQASLITADDVEFSVIFNFSYVVEMLTALQKQKVERVWCQLNTLKPSKFTLVGNRPDITYILMPMHINR